MTQINIHGVQYHQDKLTCPECGAQMVLKYSGKFKVPVFYSCSQYPKCRTTHGAHPDGRALGIPANAETKKARIEAHEAFDRLWKLGGMSRGQAYAWMQQVLSLTEDEAHIGKFTTEQCVRLVAEVEKREQDEEIP